MLERSYVIESMASTGSVMMKVEIGQRKAGGTWTAAWLGVGVGVGVGVGFGFGVGVGVSSG